MREGKQIITSGGIDLASRRSGHDGQGCGFPPNPEPLNGFPRCLRRAA
jgi:hypothetical protein